MPDFTNTVGKLYINDYARHPKAPKYKGKLMLNGETYKVAAWEYQGGEGKPYIAIVLDTYVNPNAGRNDGYPKEVTQADNRKPRSRDDDEIPF